MFAQIVVFSFILRIQPIQFMRLILLILLPLVCAAQGRDHFGVTWSGETPRHEFCRHGRVGTLDDSLHQYDVQKIWCNLDVSLAMSQIHGDVRMLVAFNEIDLPRIDLRFTDNLIIDSVISPTHTVDSVTQRGDDSLQIYLSPALQFGDTADFTIYYGGTPVQIDTWGGMRFAPAQSWRSAICFTLGDGLDLETPPANYNWLPSFADPNDKVLWECRLTVPANNVGVSAGIRLPHVVNPDSTVTWHYRLDQPVSTYLLFVSVSDYVIMTQRESNPVIENFVYPQRVTQAEFHFEPVPACLDSFAANFGPFVFDRFGYNMTRIGDMEHATSVSHYDGAVVSNRGWDWILFHEMSHHWWGDWVTCGDWRDLWLNEGFATYCEALGMEWIRGEQAFRDYVRTDIQLVARAAGNQSTIYDPDYFWGGIVYEKGASVMHMLRWVMGDSLFFTALRDYGQQYAFSTATTVEFQAVCEVHYGSSLQWFFDQWVFEGTGYPQYDVVMEPTQSFSVTQRQSGTQFTMPVEVEFWSGNSRTGIDTLWIDPELLSYAPDVPFDSVSFDPRGWLLKTLIYTPNVSVQDVAVAHAFAVSAAYPNPFNPTLTIEFTAPRAQAVTMRAYNINGQLVHEQGVLAAPGANSIAWNAAAQASGIYMITLGTAHETRTVKAVLLK